MGVDVDAIAGYGIELNDKILCAANALDELDASEFVDFMYDTYKVHVDYSGSHYTGEYTFHAYISDPLHNLKSELKAWNTSGAFSRTIEEDDIKFYAEVLWW